MKNGYKANLLPDSTLASHVIQINVYALGIHQRIQKWPRLVLLYANPAGGAATEYVPPSIPTEAVEQIVLSATNAVAYVRGHAQSQRMARFFVAAAWSFASERERYAKFPLLAATDATANSNRQLLPFLNWVGADGNGDNILGTLRGIYLTP